MWIVDSSVWIDYFGGKATPQTDILHAALGRRAIGLAGIILCEVLQGYRHQQDFEAARDALLQFPIFAVGGTEMAIRSAENFQSLRRQGITVCKTLDCLIATFVIARGFSLLHSDRDFDPFELHLGMDVVR